VGAVVNAAKVMPGECIAVIGCGGVGLNVIQGARLAGASTIIAVDINDNKLEMATSFGATHVVNSNKEDAVKKVREIVQGGVDYAFEVIGLPATIKQIFGMIRKGGTAIVVGMSPAGSEVSLPALSFMTEQKTLRGTMFGDARPAIDIPRYVDLYRSHQLRLDELITRHWKLEEINQAYDALLKGEAVRGIIDL
jgi:S-(hydroxymethyl)glutathione dehydrogenase/alcohol dehydrogenase